MITPALARFLRAARPVLLASAFLAGAPPGNVAAQLVPVGGQFHPDGCYYLTLVNQYVPPGHPARVQLARQGCHVRRPDGRLFYVDDRTQIWRDVATGYQYRADQWGSWHILTSAGWAPVVRSADDVPPPPMPVPQPAPQVLSGTQAPAPVQPSGAEPAPRPAPQSRAMAPEVAATIMATQESVAKTQREMFGPKDCARHPNSTECFWKRQDRLGNPCLLTEDRKAPQCRRAEDRALNANAAEERRQRQIDDNRRIENARIARAQQEQADQRARDAAAAQARAAEEAARARADAARRARDDR